MRGLDKWIEIDLDAVKHNLDQVRSVIEPNVILIAVLKAEAYGHGQRDIARFLNQQGVDYFAVTFLYEALQLRRSGISSSILIFSPLLDEEQVKEAIDNYTTITISSQKDVELLVKVSRELRKQATVHLKMDSGLGRFGFKPGEVLEVCEELYSYPNIYLEGIYTHMADAAGDSSYTARQYERFLQVIREIEKSGYRIPIQHCANSAVLLKYPHMHLDAVRIGTLLSGQHPVGDTGLRLNLRDPYRFKSRITSLRVLNKGTYLGYYRTYRLRKQAQVAVVPVGFNDGLGLEIANPPAGFIDLVKGIARQILVYLNWPGFGLSIIIKGRAFPIRGKVFMQMALVEIPLEFRVSVGDEVEIPVRKTLAAKNITRLYLIGGEAVKAADAGTTTFV